MDASRVDRILEEWAAVAGQARRPVAPRRFVVRSGLSGSTLAGASLAVAAVVIAVLWLGGRGPNGSGGIHPTSPDPTGSPVATPTPAPTIGPCDSTKLLARITLWEGAAGHRIAQVELTNFGPGACTLTTMARPQLVDGQEAVLIDGSSPATSELLTLAPGPVLTTLVQVGNYCGPAPVTPVSVAFLLGDGGTFVAAPFSPTDATLPPCLGAPGSAGTIEMQPWAP